MYRKHEARRKFAERRTWTYRASCWDRRCGDQDSRRPISCARPLPRPWTRSSGDVSVAPSGSSGPCCLDGTSSLPRESARCLVDTPATDRKLARTCPRVAVALDRSTFLVSENPFPISHIRFVFFNLQYSTFNSWSFILDLGSVVIDSRLPILIVLFYNCNIRVNSYFYKYRKVKGYVRKDLFHLLSKYYNKYYDFDTLHNFTWILCAFRVFLKFPKSNYDYAILNILYIFTYVYILHICNFKFRCMRIKIRRPLINNSIDTRFLILARSWDLGCQFPNYRLQIPPFKF